MFTLTGEFTVSDVTPNGQLCTLHFFLLSLGLHKNWQKLGSKFLNFCQFQRFMNRKWLNRSIFELQSSNLYHFEALAKIITSSRVKSLSLPRPGHKTQTRFFWCSLPSTFYICAHPTRYTSTNKEKKWPLLKFQEFFKQPKLQQIKLKRFKQELKSMAR